MKKEKVVLSLDSKMGFSKYRWKTVGWVLENDPAYIGNSIYYWSFNKRVDKMPKTLRWLWDHHNGSGMGANEYANMCAGLDIDEIRRGGYGADGRVISADCSKHD